MFAKSKSAGEDWRLQPSKRSAVTQPAAMLHPSQTISSIGSETMVVGKILCNEALNIYGLIEGEVIASSAFIADGAQVHGDIIAEELIVGGRVNGNIHALRVKLQATAVVEGDISHRSLSIDEHAWFEGCSRPKGDPPEPQSSIKLENSTPQPRQQALVAFNDQEEFQPGFTEPTQLRQSGMRAFLAACITITVIGVMSYLASAPCKSRQGSRIRPAMSELIQAGWIDRHSLARRSCCSVPKALLSERRFRRRRKRQPLRPSLRQLRRKRTLPFLTRSRCRRVSRCRKRSRFRLLLRQLRRKPTPPLCRSRCRR